MEAAEIPEGEKVTVVGEIETIKAQLAKPSPNRNIVKQAWSAIDGLVTAHGLGTILVEAAKYINPLIS